MRHFERREAVKAEAMISEAFGGLCSSQRTNPKEMFGVRVGSHPCAWLREARMQGGLPEDAANSPGVPLAATWRCLSSETDQGDTGEISVGESYVR